MRVSLSLIHYLQTVAEQLKNLFCFCTKYGHLIIIICRELPSLLYVCLYESEEEATCTLPTGDVHVGNTLSYTLLLM